VQRLKRTLAQAHAAAVGRNNRESAVANEFRRNGSQGHTIVFKVGEELAAILQPEQRYRVLICTRNVLIGEAS
jgi:Spy/CpxP family protein refolding chaperone